MSRTCIKLCGLKNIDDLVYADSLDVDLLGIIFTPQSPRCISKERLKEISNLRIHKPLVGVFMDQPIEYVNEIKSILKLDYLQFHGSETHEYCTYFKMPFIKTLHIGSQQIIFDQMLIKSASMVLFDNQKCDQKGGTGTTFDWTKLINEPSLQEITDGEKYLIAGGLNLDNIDDLLVTYKPKGLDVSSGLENNIGVKSHDKMERFVNIVRTYDN